MYRKSVGAFLEGKIKSSPYIVKIGGIFLSQIEILMHFSYFPSLHVLCFADTIILTCGTIAINIGHHNKKVKFQTQKNVFSEKPFATVLYRNL